MSCTELKSCLTCFRKTDNFLCITGKDIVSGEDVEAVFAKHFWFSKDEYTNRVVCTSCWEKIDDFHKFYSDVEKAYAPAKIIEVKVEPLDNSDIESSPSGDEGQITSQTNYEAQGDVLGKCFMYEGTVCKEENSKNNSGSIESDNLVKQEEDDRPYTPSIKENDSDDSEDSDTDEEEEEEDEDDDDDDYVDIKPLKAEARATIAEQLDSPPVKRKSGHSKSKRQTKDVQQFDLTCHRCAEEGNGSTEVFKTFYRLNQHCKKIHNINGYIFCCNRRWPSKKQYLIHCSNHDVIKKMRCFECNCSFKTESGLAKHMFMVHTPEEAKLFKCHRCTKAFAAEDLLSSHLSWHDELESKNFYCPTCNKYFYCAANLENHLQTHHNPNNDTLAPPVEMADDNSNEQPTDSNQGTSSSQKKKRGTPEEIAEQEELIKKFITLNCSKCDFVSETFKGLTRHAQVVHNISTYSVVCCDRRFSKRFRLYEHCLRHLNPDHFKCELCGKTFTDSSGLQHHNWWIHTPVSERPFKCDICGDAFVKEYLLKQHMDKHIDRARKTHTCETCNITYSNALQLKSHQQRVHGAVSDWVCDVCARGFTHRSLLEKHRLTHTKEGLAILKKQCEKCHKWLMNKKGYLRHRRRCFDTSGPVKCDVCGLESVNEFALMQHKKLHHSNKAKYPCSYCGKEFKKQLRCKEHEANHAGIVLYRCPYCPRMCNSSSNMYTHKKVAHPEQWAEAVAARMVGP